MEPRILTLAPWLVPLLLVGLQFLLKLFIAERAAGMDAWLRLLQNPVDIGFLALSFVCTVIISDAARASAAFVIALVYLLVLILVVATWKYTPTTIKKRRKAAFLLIMNYVFSIPLLVYSVRLLGGK